MRETLERGKEAHSPSLLTLLESRLDKCQIKLEKLQAELSKLSPELSATHETLVSVLRSTAAVNTRSKVSDLSFAGRSQTDKGHQVLCCGGKLAPRATAEDRRFNGGWEIYRRGRESIREPRRCEIASPSVLALD
jgi:hypothetical protein